ncbi:MAG: proton-conducting transporter membrane subunit [Actinomycetota bacterium]|nr:proton-conducting transporter membrane subunit [Actinomycetota bacterium]
MGWDLVLLMVVPAVAGVACWWAPVSVGRAIGLTSGVLTFVLAVLLVPSGHAEALGSWLRVDPLSVVFLVAIGFLYPLTMAFAVGYLHPAGDPDAVARYHRRVLAGLNLFCWAMVVAPLMNSLALLWVAIEVTTVISALLVAVDDTPGATEAAWKYVLIASMGLGIALFATIVVYYAGSTVLGNGYELFIPQLLAHARHFPSQAVRLAFVLAVLGFGTKVGFVPVHTWLPDAHSEAPTPVSALLSGALLAMSFYAVLRYFQVAVRTLGGTFPRDVLLAFGIASLVLAALSLSAQRDLKRLLAYSSIEHMGILAIGMSFAAPIAVAGVLLQVLAHAAAKGTAFFGAGSIVRRFGTKDMARIRGGIAALPWSGPLFVLAILGLSAMPPFGIFRSEFQIVEGGLSDPQDAVVAVLVVLVVLAFAGLSWFSTRTMFSPSSGQTAVARGEPSAWIVGAMAVGIVALAVLGVHPPGQLSQLLSRAASELGAPR